MVLVSSVAEKYQIIVECVNYEKKYIFNEFILSWNNYSGNDFFFSHEIIVGFVLSVEKKVCFNKLLKV